MVKKAMNEVKKITKEELFNILCKAYKEADMHYPEVIPGSSSSFRPNYMVDELFNFLTERGVRLERTKRVRSDE
jgi:hypothetical protein